METIETLNLNSTVVQTVEKKNYHLLTKSILLTGLLFIIIGLGSFGFSFPLMKYTEQVSLKSWIWAEVIIILALMVGGIISEFVFMSRRPWWVATIVLAIYCIAASFGFGFLFALLRKYNAVDMGAMSFVAIGGVYLAIALVVRLFKKGAVLTFGIIATIIGIIGGLVSGPFWIFAIIGVVNPGGFSWASANYILNFIIASSIVVGCCELMYDIWKLKKEEEDTWVQFKAERANYVLSSTTIMLTGLLAILFKVLIYVIRIAAARQRSSNSSSTDRSW